jgi:MFS family permease
VSRTPLLPVLLAGFSAFLGFYATQPLLPLFSRVFHADAFAVSLTVTAPSVAVAIAAPFVGRFSDVWGRRRVIVVTAFLLAVTAALCSTARDLRQLTMWRFVQGLVTPGIFAVALAYIHEEFRAAEVGRITAAYVSGTVVGGFVGRAVAGVTAFYRSWRASFAALAALNLVCAVLVWLWLPNDRVNGGAGRSATHIESLRAHVMNRELLVTYAVGFCVLFTQVA